MNKVLTADSISLSPDGMVPMGGVATRLLSNNMSADSLRPWVSDKDNLPYVNHAGSVMRTNAATLRKDEWKQYDSAIVESARIRLSGIADLMGRGLTYNIGNGLGKTVIEYEDMGDMSAASMNMDGMTRGQRDRPEYAIKYLPLPIIHKDFYINARVLAASRTTGSPLDTTMAALAGQTVAEKLENLLFNGSSSFTFGGGTIYGYTDFPYRNTLTLSTAWDGSAMTGELILDDVKAMKQASIDDRHYGPWVLYIPTNYETVLDGDFKAGSDKTIRQRILEIAGITDVKVSDTLTADNVILVQMTSNVVRLVTGMPIQSVEWSTEGGMVLNYKVMTIQVPQLRADQAGRSGIVHLS